jgi:hypothetical protein
MIPFIISEYLLKGFNSRAGGVVQAVQCLSSKHEALNSNTCTKKKVLIQVSGKIYQECINLVPMFPQ